MQFRTALVIALLSVCAAYAQIPNEELRSKITGVPYSRLAEAARIQGDVHLILNSGVVTVLSGHPLLAPTAVESAKLLGSIQGETDLDVTYHFVIADTITNVATPITVKRGNALERAILRIFGLKTEKVVLEYRCQGVAPANDVEVTGQIIEIWVYGKTSCLETETANLVAQR
jgi:hypothetical protein